MLTRPRLGGPLGLDPNDLTAAEGAAVRAGLMGRLGTLALRARDEGHRAKREVAAALALRRPGYALLGLSCHGSVLLRATGVDSTGAWRSAVGVELLKTAQRPPSLVGERLVLVLVRMRLDVLVAAAHRTEAQAVGAADRRERRREDELLAQEGGQVDPEIRRDRLRVQRRGRLFGAAQHIHRAVVLLPGASEHRRLDRGEATAALLRHPPAGPPLPISAPRRVGRGEVPRRARH